MDDPRRVDGVIDPNKINNLMMVEQLDELAGKGTDVRRQMTSDEYKWDMSIDDIIEDLIHDLRGEVWVENDDPNTPTIEGSWVKVKELQLVNESGIHVIKIVLRDVNKNLLMTNFNDQEVNVYGRTIRENLAQILAINHEKYEIDKSSLNVIMDKLAIFMRAALKRAYMGEERRSKREGVQRKYIYSDNLKEKEKEGLWLFKR